MDAELDWAVRAPHPALRHVVRRYVGYRQHGVTLAVHRGLPSRSITLVMSFAEPLRLVGGPGAERGPTSMSAAVGGLHLAPVLIEQDRHQFGLHLELNPIGLRALLGVAAGELTSDVVDLASLPVPWARGLPDRLAAQPDWTARFDVLDTVLSTALHPVTLVSEVQWAWRRMVAGHGGTQVTELADQVGWSRRHFSQRFTDQVGLSPKQVARLVRFERSAELLRAGGSSLAAVAAEAGYYDQAHLSNEWRALAGCTPTEWIRAELPFLQDPSVDPEPDSAP